MSLRPLMPPYLLISATAASMPTFEPCPTKLAGPVKGICTPILISLSVTPASAAKVDGLANRPVTQITNARQVETKKPRSMGTPKSSVCFLAN